MASEISDRLFDAQVSWDAREAGVKPHAMTWLRDEYEQNDTKSALNAWGGVFLQRGMPAISAASTWRWNDGI